MKYYTRDYANCLNLPTCTMLARVEDGQRAAEVWQPTRRLWATPPPTVDPVTGRTYPSVQAGDFYYTGDWDEVAETEAERLAAQETADFEHHGKG